MFKGNKGEWGEIYAFCILLRNGILQAADENLEPIKNIFFPIIKIIRGDYSYFPSKNSGDKIKVCHRNKLFVEFPTDILDGIIKKLNEAIPEGKGAFEINECNDFFDFIKINKIKANSTKKRDIEILIHDINTGINTVCGFSIKSYLGSNPTLVNAGKSTNFKYQIEGCSEDIKTQFNMINTQQKLIDRISFLDDHGLCITFTKETFSKQFKVNMRYIDTLMPQIMGECLLKFYTGKKGVKDVRNIIEEVAQTDKFQLECPDMYEYKMKLFLCACALGMTPEKKWVGGEDANGGYITVKKDGSVVCFHIYNRTNFYDYLYNYTYFEKSSSSRHEYMSIFEEDGKYFINLNLQIRFKPHN